MTFDSQINLMWDSEFREKRKCMNQSGFFIDRKLRYACEQCDGFGHYVDQIFLLKCSVHREAVAVITTCQFVEDYYWRNTIDEMNQKVWYNLAVDSSTTLIIANIFGHYHTTFHEVLFKFQLIFFPFTKKCQCHWQALWLFMEELFIRWLMIRNCAVYPKLVDIP